LRRHKREQDAGSGESQATEQCGGHERLSSRLAVVSLIR
jgi:hypothetical protein